MNTMRVNTRFHSSSMGGNQCGHSPNCPREFITPTHHKPRPEVLRTAITHLKHYYQDPDQWLSFIPYSRDSKRQQRSESREAVMALLQVILHYTELSTLRVGIPQPDGTFAPLTLTFLAKKAQLSLKRVLRALQVLYRTGYIQVQYRFKVLPQGLIQNLAAIRQVNVCLFTDLKIKPSQLQQAREQAQWRLARFQRTVQKGVEQGRQAFTAINHQAKQSFKRTFSRLSSTPIAQIEAERTKAAEALRLHTKHPDWSWERIKLTIYGKSPPS